MGNKTACCVGGMANIFTKWMKKNWISMKKKEENLVMRGNGVHAKEFGMFFHEMPGDVTSCTLPAKLAKHQTKIRWFSPTAFKVT